MVAVPSSSSRVTSSSSSGPKSVCELEFLREEEEGGRARVSPM